MPTADEPDYDLKERRHLEKSRKLLGEVLTVGAQGRARHQRQLLASVDVAAHGFLKT